MNPYRTLFSLPAKERGQSWGATRWRRFYARYIWPMHCWFETGEWELRVNNRRFRTYLVRLDSWKALYLNREHDADGRPVPTPPCPPPLLLRS